MKPVLETDKLAIGYSAPRKADVIVADNLDLELAKGQLVCLLGPNGAGKSTLMRTFAGMQKPLEGRVMLAGKDINTLKPHQLATYLSIVLTERPNLGLLNGYSLVALGRHPYTDWMGKLSEYDEAVVHWAVDAVGASDIAHQPVVELSDGQRQKLMIARALAQESDIILLDEPTAYLDLPRRVEIMRLLHHLAAETGRAILLSTHDLDLALRSADSLWLMSGGKIRVGTPEDLVLNGAFEEAFHSEGVKFDRATGTFSMEYVTGRTVSIIGDGIPHNWTRRALSRAGFQLVNDTDNTSHGSIDISEDDTQPVWHLRHKDKEKTYRSIHDLLDALQHLQTDENPQSSTLTEDTKPRPQDRRKRTKRGLVLVNTGDGKGKTTASLGVILRMLGRKKRVSLIQFLKHEGGQWGEVRGLAQLGLDAVKTGDGWTWTSKDIDESQSKALHGWNIAKDKITSGDYDLVVLDEFTYLLDFGWLDTTEVLNWLEENKPEELNLIITGRGAPQALIDYADTVTNMTNIKHAYDAGIPARAGIEF